MWHKEFALSLFMMFNFQFAVGAEETCSMPETLNLLEGSQSEARKTLRAAIEHLGTGRDREANLLKRTLAVLTVNEDHIETIRLKFEWKETMDNDFICGRRDTGLMRV